MVPVSTGATLKAVEIIEMHGMRWLPCPLSSRPRMVDPLKRRGLFDPYARTPPPGHRDISRLLLHIVNTTATPGTSPKGLKQLAEREPDNQAGKHDDGGIHFQENDRGKCHNSDNV